MTGLTPMMRQYLDIKEKHKDAILFFRLGDFYEMFFDDAVTASRELEITLTGRDCGLKERAPMCGVPFHSCDTYISKLIMKGYKVAICEQVEDASKAVGIVKRDVVRVITPGTVTDLKMLEEKQNNYLACIFSSEEGYGISYVDVSTGEFFLTEIKEGNMILRLTDEITKINPSEVITNRYFMEDNETRTNLEHNFSLYIWEFNQSAFEYESAYERIKRQLSVINLEGYGCEGKELSIIATGALLEYLDETQKIVMSHINSIHYYTLEDYMVLDAATRSNLELTRTIRDNSKKGSLLWLMDSTNTSMGGRLLKKWIEQPLTDKKLIEERLEGVGELAENYILMEDLREQLSKIYDIQRLMGKISYGNANARDLISLKQSIQVIPDIKEIMSRCKTEKLMKVSCNIDTLEDIFQIIDEAIVNDPPLAIIDGGIIKEGFNSKVDELRSAIKNGKQWIIKLENSEKEKTGIKSLKVGFNKVFGYYIDVTKSYYSKVPDNYVRKQTLANSERYITPELKEMEEKILGAEEKIIQLEYELFTDIRKKISCQVARIQDTSSIIAEIDCLYSLSRTAVENNYCKPHITDDGIIDIKQGRHPVVEKLIKDELFVSNNTLLDCEENRFAIITGPNMAGKSTYMRQVALIVLMAQTGSFVPAKEAHISICDRIFTRVGAADDLGAGKSTFMVEMTEVANILNNATSESLLLLDEIGRGTSTFDGLSIAWAVIEYINNPVNIGAKTLFATHYHELTELEGNLKSVKNYYISVKELGDDIIFLRKIIRGGADKSFGIQVAKLAGIPDAVIKRAQEILKRLEESDINNQALINRINGKGINILRLDKRRSKRKEHLSKEQLSKEQLSFEDYRVNEIFTQLKNMDVSSLTPMEAINILYKLHQKAKESIWNE